MNEKFELRNLTVDSEEGSATGEVWLVIGLGATRLATVEAHIKRRFMDTPLPYDELLSTLKKKGRDRVAQYLLNAGKTIAL